MIDRIPTAIDIRSASDDRVVELLAMAQDELARVKSDFDGFIQSAKNELERRMIERGASAIPSQTHEITLEPEWSAYRYDLEKLRDAARNLPPEEAAKILKHVPEVVIPAHDEPGPAVSISALAKKYAGSEVGVILAQAQQRDPLGVKVTVKPRKPALKSVTK